MKTLLFIFLILFSLKSVSQWESLGYGFNGPGYGLYFDSTNNHLYACGFFKYADSILVNHFAVWDGVKWDSLGRGAPYGAPGVSITKFQGNVFGSSVFYYYPPNYDVWLAYWDGQKWDSLNQNFNDAINTFKEHNNELYLGGTFTKIGTQGANLLAKYDGVNFTPINVPSLAGGFSVKDIEFFQGQMYIGGNFYDTITGVNDLERWDGTSFQPFGGNGLAFGAEMVSAMEIFQNDLYIGGHFLTSSGSPANNIMRWDGSQFYDIGGGLNGGVLKMKVFDNELYVCGAFTLAGNVNVNGLAKWDGSQWLTVVPGVFNNNIIDFYKNGSDFYVTGGFTFIDSIPLKYIAKFTGLIGIAETEISKDISLSPSPALTHLKITSPQTNIHSSSIFDITGKLLLKKEVIAASFQLDVSSLAAGLYFLVLETPKGTAVKKFVKE